MTQLKDDTFTPGPSTASTSGAAKPLAAVGAPGSPAAQLFNSSIEAFSVVAAAEFGLLERLDDAGPVTLEAFTRENDLHLPSVTAVVTALAGAGIVTVSTDEAGGSTIWPTEVLGDFRRTSGFFTWLLGGCGELLRTAGSVARQSSRTGHFIRRDARMIGLGTGHFGAQFIDPVVDTMLREHPFSCIGDLGCGGGTRLIRALRQYPQATGVGVDIAPDAVALAREQIAAAGLSDRAVVVEGDVHTLTARREFKHVDLLTSFLMGHDFWPREQCVDLLRRLPRVFPALNTFALCDTFSSQSPPGQEFPLLTQGFEHVHALMGQYVPTLAEWREVFTEAGWRVRTEYDLELPPMTKIFDAVPLRGGRDE